MLRFVAFLRGINVGKANRLPMAELRGLLAKLGYAEVTTLLNSGNAVFQAASGTSARHAGTISGAISKRFGLDVPVIVKSVKELSAIIAENPITADSAVHPRFLVALVQDAKALAAIRAIESLVVAPERFAVGHNAAYLLCANGILESKAAAALLGKTGRAATSRNLATLLKLEALANGRAG